MTERLLGDEAKWLASMEGDAGCVCSKKESWKRLIALARRGLAAEDELQRLTNITLLKSEQAKRIVELEAQASKGSEACLAWAEKVEKLEAQVAEMRFALKKAKTFIEYARHELEPGKAEIGAQFPGQVDADNEIEHIERALLSSASEGWLPPEKVQKLRKLLSRAQGTMKSLCTGDGFDNGRSYPDIVLEIGKVLEEKP